MQKDLLAAARRYLGTPFCHQGRTAEGLDCFGLVLVACRDSGLLSRIGLPPEYDTQHYTRYPASYQLLTYLDRYLVRLSTAPLAPGQLAVFRLGRGDTSHLGLLADGALPCSLIHAWGAKVPSMAKVIEHRLDGRWQRRIAARYGFPQEEA